MAIFRVPYPDDPGQRRLLFDRVSAELARHGHYQGTPESGSFRGATPVGDLAGHYRSPEGADFLEIELTQKPWLVPLSVIENEVRKFLAQV